MVCCCLRCARVLVDDLDMLRDRALIRSAALAAIVVAAWFSLTPSAGAASTQVEVGSANADAAGVLVAPPVEAAPSTIVPPVAVAVAVGFLPAAEIPPAAPSSLSTVVIVAGFALLLFGSIAMVAGSWHRLVPTARNAAAGLQVRTAPATGLPLS